MEINMKQLAGKDYRKIINFAIEGMNFNSYFKRSFAVHLFGRYFFYKELERSTQVIAAYMGDQVVGVVMVAMKDEAKLPSSLWRRFYVNTYRKAMKLLAKNEGSIYDQTNEEMLASFRQQAKPDGEICFLAADPNIQGKGIGSKLLKAVEKSAKGQLLYLYTDDDCSYQFYDYKGFDRSEQRTITFGSGNDATPLKCFLYSKRF